MNTIRSLICLVLVIAVADVMLGAELKVERHGEEQALHVKKKPMRFFHAASDGTWQLRVQGPATIALGLRVLGSGKLPEGAEVVAELDGEASVSTTALKLRQSRDTKLPKKQKGLKVSDEAVITYVVGAGDHRLRILLHGVDKGLLRHVLKIPKGVIKAEPFIDKETRAVAAAMPPTAAASSPRAPAPPTATPTLAESVDAAADIAKPTVAPTGDLVIATEAPRTDTRDVSPSARALFPVTAKLGVGVQAPQVVTKLSTGWHGNVGLGYLLPVLSQRIEVVADVSMSEASRDASATDARLLEATSYDFELRERELLVGLSGVVRFHSPAQPGLNYFGRAGARLDLQRSDVNGSVIDADFGRNYEAKAEVGVILGGGVEYRLGPGAIAAELNFAFADLHQRVSGDSSAGGLGLNVGYHFML